MAPRKPANKRSKKKELNRELEMARIARKEAIDVTYHSDSKRSGVLRAAENELVKASPLPGLGRGPNGLQARKERAAKPKVRKPDPVHVDVPVLNPRLTRYFQSLSDPFGEKAYGSKCPVNYNPAMTTSTTTCRTTVTIDSVQVASGGVNQYTVFAGHAQPSTASAMDAESYHSKTVTAGTTPTVYVPGPVTVGANVGACVYETTGLASGAIVTNLATAATTAKAWDETMPYTGSDADGHHTRWKLVSMAVKIANLTYGTSRGGSVKVTMPTFVTVGVNQKSYSKEPTTETSEVAIDGTWEVRWIPKQTDQAFWHSNTASTTTNADGAAMLIWLDAVATPIQWYNLQFVFNWEIAGANLQQVSAPVMHMPSDRNITEPVIATARNSDASNHVITSALSKIGAAAAISASSLVDRGINAAKAKAFEAAKGAGDALWASLAA